MTQKNKRRSAIAVTAGIAILVSACINTNNSLGSAYIPSNQDISIESVEFELPIDLKIADSIQTSTLGTALVGNITTEEFGTFTTGTAMSVIPTYDSIDWGINPVFKDFYLQIPLSKATSIDDDQLHIPQNFRAYKLLFEIDSTHVYNNSLKRSDYSKDPVSRGNAVFFGDDSLKIYFTEEFAKPLFDITDRTTLDSSELFMKKFYGIYLTADDPVEGVIGGRINQFDMSDAKGMLTVTSTNVLGERRDTLFYLSFGSYYSFNSMKSGAGHLETDNPENALYTEGLGGITPHISAIKLRNLLESWALMEHIDLNNILISKATIELPVEYWGDTYQFDNYPQNLYPCVRTEDEGYIFYEPIDEIYDSSFNDGSLDRSHMYYRPDCGKYLQALIRKKKSDITNLDDIWMMSTMSVTDSDSSSDDVNYYSDYIYYHVGVLNGTKQYRNPKLKIIYTVLK